MTEQRPSSTYLGPEKGRWTPSAWSDVVDAAAGGLLDESHWVDLKQELPAGKRTHNTELGQDLASLAIDGGLLVVGIEDHNSHAGKCRASSWPDSLIVSTRLPVTRFDLVDGAQP